MFYQIWPKVRFGIDSTEPFEAKADISYNIPALDSFRETPTDRMCPVTESAPLSPTCKFHKRLSFQDCIPNKCNKCQKSESKKTKNCVVSTSLVRHSSFRMQASRIAQMNSSSDDSGRWQVSLARGSTAHARGLLTRWCVRVRAGCLCIQWLLLKRQLLSTVLDLDCAYKLLLVFSNRLHNRLVENEQS